MTDSGTPPVLARGGTFTVLISYGDVSGNELIEAYDASLVLQHIVGLTTLDAAAITKADVTGNNVVTAYDAAYILLKVAGYIEFDDFPVVKQHMDKEFLAVSNGDARININKLEEEPNIVSYYLELKNITDVSSFQGSARFNQSEFEFIECSLTELSKDFIIETNSENGVLKWAMASGKSIKADGKILKLKFRRKGNNSSEFISFSDLMINEDLLDSKAISYESNIPERFELHQNYPNPFNPVTTIKYDIPEERLVTLKIFNLMGQEVRTLVNEVKDPGYHTVKWDARNNNGNLVSSGIYIYQIKAGNFIKQKKLIYLR